MLSNTVTDARQSSLDLPKPNASHFTLMEVRLWATDGSWHEIEPTTSQGREWAEILPFERSVYCIVRLELTGARK